jgi:signal transduction histidine kinase
VKLATEIAERERAEAEVRKILAAEQALNELKSRLVSTISHEYRTPLAVILTSTELLKRYSDRLSDEKKDTYLSRIQAAVRQLSLLVEEVLTFGKAEAGELPFHPVPLDLVEFCDRLVEEQRLLASDRHVIEFTPNSPELQAQLDEQLMRHIVINLLSNAIKYSPKGGLVEVSLRQEEHTIHLQVRDQGIGIPAADRPYLFGSFFRASNVGSIPGTGMGLSIVKKSVELHGGEIAIDSEEAVGTTVTVTLPIDGKPV